MGSNVSRSAGEESSNTTDLVSTHSSHSTIPSRVLPELKKFATAERRDGLHKVPLVAQAPDDIVPRYDVNVVTVHGLGGDPFRTWVYESKDRDIYWPSELLPTDLPGCQVFAFGYDSNPKLSRSIVDVRIAATMLLQDLLPVHEKAPDRTFIFICHSLGGLVIKQAMIFANQDDTYLPILQHTRTILFLGTPHRGSELASFFKPMARLSNVGLKYSGASRFVGRTRTDLLKTLSPNSRDLDGLNADFLRRTKDVVIISCYETLERMGWNDVIVRESSALIGDREEQAIPLYAHHGSICCFSSPDDPNYIKVARALARSITPLKVESSRKSITKSEKEFISTFIEEMPGEIDSHSPGTCGWFIETVQFRMWERAETSAILWLTGQAGCGKTVLISYLVQYLVQNPPTRLPSVLSFFCDRGYGTKKNAVPLVKRLIYQLLEGNRHLIRWVKDEFVFFNLEYDSSFDRLWHVFESIVLKVDCRPCIIIIDAIDECDLRSRHRLLDKIHQLLRRFDSSSSTSSKCLKFVISGQSHVRPVTVMDISDPKCFHVDLDRDPDGTRHDIEQFINNEIDDFEHMAVLSTNVRESLRTNLLAKADNSFMWTKLVLNDIRKSPDYSQKDIEKNVTNLPTDLGKVYAKYLPALDTSGSLRQTQYLQVLMASSRPLNLEEIDLLMEAGKSASFPVALTEDTGVIRKGIQRALGPLIKTSEKFTVQLVHSSVRDFLLGIDQYHGQLALRPQDLDEDAINLFLAQCCIRYLLHDEFKASLHRVRDVSSALSQSSRPPSEAMRTCDDIDSANDDMDIQALFETSQFAMTQEETLFDNGICSKILEFYGGYDYAACNWCHHYARSEHMAPDWLKEAALQLLNYTSTAARNWYLYMSNQAATKLPPVSSISSMILAAVFDHPLALDRFLNESAVSAKNLSFALTWAASKGHARIVKRLLDNGACMDQSSAEPSALHHAAEGNFFEVCSLLIAADGVDLNHYNRFAHPPIVLAAQNNNCEIIHLLLSQKRFALPEAIEFVFMAVVGAIEFGADEALRILLQHEESLVCFADAKGRTALIYATMKNSQSSIDHILAQPNVKTRHADSQGRNAISYASERGNKKAVQQLLKAGERPSAKDLSGRNAISWAANSWAALKENDKSKKNGKPEKSVLEHLVCNFPEAADTEDDFGWTPLFWALERPGYLPSIKILVENGSANPAACDSTGRSMLAWAANEGFADIVQYLLSLGMDARGKDHSGRTALANAAAHGMKSVVDMLLKHDKVTVHIRDNKGRKPQDWAKLNGHLAVAELLARAESG